MLKKRDINKIIKMHKKKIPIRKIAKAIRASPTTVMAHIKKWKQNIQQNEATIQEQANDVNSEEARSIKRKSEKELKRIPPFKKDVPNDIWLRAFFDYYDSNKAFIDFQIQKMKKNLNILPSVSKLDDDINRMDSGINKLRWKAHISKVYEEYLSDPVYPSTISSPYITPYLGSDPLVKPDTQKTTVEKASIPKGGASEKSVSFSVTQRKETAPVEKEGKISAIKESSDKFTQTKEKEDPVTGGNPEESGGSIWPAIGVGLAIGGGILVGKYLLNKQKEMAQVQEGEKVTTCPQCKNEIIYDGKFTEFSCPCGAYLFIFRCPCQREIAYDEKCTRLNCPCGISMNIEFCPNPNCQGKIIYDARSPDFNCPFCGVKLSVSNNKLIVSKSKTNYYGGTIIA